MSPWGSIPTTVSTLILRHQKQQARTRHLFLEEYSETKVFEITTTPFFQRFVRPRIFKEEPDEPHTREVMENELPPVLDYLSGELGNDDFLIDNQFCIADIAVCSPFVNMQIGSEHVDATLAEVQRVFGASALAARI